MKRKFFKDLAETMSSLNALNMVKNINTELKTDEITKKQVLEISVVGPENVLYLCLKMLKDINNSGFKLTFQKVDSNNPNNSILTVKFFEQ